MSAEGRHRLAPAARGFTLIELAIGLVIIAVVVGALLTPLQAQVEQARFGQTQRQLDEIREALIGFAIANGRLPCPATAASNGVADPPTGGACSAPQTGGFVPAVTLGLAGVDGQGFAVDAWGLPQNRIRYAVTSRLINGFRVTDVDGLNQIARTAGGLAALGTQPDLFVCSTQTGMTVSACAAGARLGDQLIAVLFSLGPNAAAGGASADEAENLNSSPGTRPNGFVSRPRAGAGAPAGEFDDIVTWLAPSLLIARMTAAAQLQP